MVHISSSLFPKIMNFDEDFACSEFCYSDVYEKDKNHLQDHFLETVNCFGIIPLFITFDRVMQRVYKEEEVNKKCILLLLELMIQVMEQNNYQPDINELYMLSEITMHHLVSLYNYFGDDVIPMCFRIINRLSSLDIGVK